MKLTPEQSEHVEEFGRFWESVFGSRTAGRIVGWLMICEPPHQSAADLVDVLHISAGSVSTQVRHLELLGLVERVTFHGDRARYYQLPDGVWTKVMHGEQSRIATMYRLAAAAASVAPRTRRERVAELETVAGFLVDEWPGLMERMQNRLVKGIR